MEEQDTEKLTEGGKERSGKEERGKETAQVDADALRRGVCGDSKRLGNKADVDKGGFN